MRVAVDARELEGHPTGVGRVLAGLLGAWPGVDELVLLSRRGIDETFVREPVRQLTRAGPRWLPGALWEQWWLPRLVEDAQADVLLSPAYGMPRSPGRPTVVGMHDCACFALPHEFSWRQRLRRQYNARLAARRAAFLFMGSQFAADEAQRFLGVGPERTLVLPYGVDQRFRRQSETDIRRVTNRYGLEGRVVLFVGAHLGRRLLPQLHAAVAPLLDSRPDVSLCIAGERPADAAGPLGIDHPRARWLGWVEDADLPALYAAATVVAYPSTYEGFGLPVLEGLACGTPVVTSAAGSLGEIYADRAEIVAEDDPERWREAIARLLDDPEERRRAVDRAADWANGRRWSPAAEQLREAVAAIVRGNR